LDKQYKQYIIVYVFAFVLELKKKFYTNIIQLYVLPNPNLYSIKPGQVLYIYYRGEHIFENNYQTSIQTARDLYAYLNTWHA